MSIIHVFCPIVKSFCVLNNIFLIRSFRGADFFIFWRNFKKGVKNAVFVSYLREIKNFQVLLLYLPFPVACLWRLKNIFQKTFIFSLSREFRVRDIKNLGIFARWFTFCPCSWFISEKQKLFLQNPSFFTSPEAYRWGIKTFFAQRGWLLPSPKALEWGEKLFKEFLQFFVKTAFLCAVVY